MTLKQLNRLIDVFNNVREAPTEVHIDALTGEELEVVDISHEDWEIFNLLLNHQYTETVKMGSYEYSITGHGSIKSYHSKDQTVHKWVKDDRSLFGIQEVIVSLMQYSTYKKVKYEELLEDWREFKGWNEEEKNGLDKD